MTTGGHEQCPGAPCPLGGCPLDECLHDEWIADFAADDALLDGIAAGRGVEEPVVGDLDEDIERELAVTLGAWRCSVRRHPETWAVDVDRAAVLVTRARATSPRPRRLLPVTSMAAAAVAGLVVVLLWGTPSPTSGAPDAEALATSADLDDASEALERGDLSAARIALARAEHRLAAESQDHAARGLQVRYRALHDEVDAGTSRQPRTQGPWAGSAARSETVGHTPRRPSRAPSESASGRSSDGTIADGSSPDRSRAERPRAERPTAERPRPERPTAERPRAERPTAERPRAERPRAERPRADGPRADGPRVELPTTERPRAERPRAERPRADRPRAERPTTERPSAERPTTQRPRAERPEQAAPPRGTPTVPATDRDDPRTRPGDQPDRTGATRPGEGTTGPSTPDRATPDRDSTDRDSTDRDSTDRDRTPPSEADDDEDDDDEEDDQYWDRGWDRDWDWDRDRDRDDEDD